MDSFAFTSSSDLVVLVSEFVDNIMMSPKYWNLPKPGLIISITGNAADFKPDQALSAEDVPYVMFSLFNLKQPENRVFVPVRESDCLSDVLFRLSDFSACRGTSDPSFLTTSRSLRNFGGFVSKTVDLGEPDFIIEKLEFKQENKTLTLQPPNVSLISFSSDNYGGVHVKIVGKLPALTVASSITIPDLKKIIAEKIGIVQDQRIFIVKDEDATLGHLSLENLSQYISKQQHTELSKDIPLSENVRCIDKGTVVSGFVILAEKGNPFENFLKSLDFYSTVNVAVHVVPDEKNHKFNIFPVHHEKECLATDRGIALSALVGRPKAADRGSAFSAVDRDFAFSALVGSPKAADRGSAFSAVDRDFAFSALVGSPKSSDKIDAKNHKFNLFRVVKAIESIEVFEDSVLESSNVDSKSKEGTHLWELPVFEDDKIGDLKRRIENRSLEMVKDGSYLKYPTLPQPFWQASTLILYNETEGKKESKTSLLLKEEDFDKFKKNFAEEDFTTKTFDIVLLRTHGSGCQLYGEVIDRILHEAAFLLPLTFGSIWIIDGGLRMGIMKVTFVPRWIRLFPNVLISDLRRCTGFVIWKNCIGQKRCYSNVPNFFDWVCNWNVYPKRHQYGKISGKLHSFQIQQAFLVSQEHFRILQLRNTPLPPGDCRRRKKRLWRRNSFPE
jgi:hypothetical protein